MSVDVHLSAEGCCDSHSHQFTYNYTPALQAVGFPGWKMLNGVSASVALMFLDKAVKELESDRERYNALIRGGGEWGTIDTLLEQLGKLRADIMRHDRRGIIFAS